MIGGTLFAGAAAVAFFSIQSGNVAGSDPSVTAAGVDEKQRIAIEAIVRNYILENPEIIPEAVEILQQRQNVKRISAIRNTAETPFAGAWAGNKNGDVVLVEFSDFACGFCRRSNADVERLISEDPNLKVVYRELPILSDASADAAKMAMAAARQGKYKAFHKAMFGGARPNNASIQLAAKKAGLDLTKANVFIASEASQTEIDSNLNIARTMEFTGTPAWIVGNQSMVGAVGYSELKKAISETRAAK